MILELLFAKIILMIIILFLGGKNMPELKVLNQKITYIKIDDEDYISITDMLIILNFYKGLGI